MIKFLGLFFPFPNKSVDNWRVSYIFRESVNACRSALVIFFFKIKSNDVDDAVAELLARCCRIDCIPGQVADNGRVNRRFYFFEKQLVRARPSGESVMRPLNGNALF